MVECVQSGGVVADVGCDHGFTAIELVESGRALRAIAMDIGEGPLLRARKHVKEHGLTGQIDCRISDGVHALGEGEADTVLISGMGGALICRILNAGRQVIAQVHELVLSPQSEPWLVRCALHNLGFCIALERMVFELGKYYVVIRAVPGTERYTQEEEYIYGKCLIDGASDVFLAYMRKELARVEGILAGIRGDACDGKLSEGRLAAKKRLEAEREQISRVLHRIT